MTLHIMTIDESIFDSIANGFRTQYHELDPDHPMQTGDTVKFRTIRGKGTGTVARICVCIVTHVEALGDDYRSPYYIYSIRRERDAK